MYSRILRSSLGASVLGYDSSLCRGDGAATPSMSKIGEFRSSLSLISPARRKSSRACCQATDNVGIKRAWAHCLDTLDNTTLKSLVEALKMLAFLINEKTNKTHNHKYCCN